MTEYKIEITETKETNAEIRGIFYTTVQSDSVKNATDKAMTEWLELFASWDSVFLSLEIQTEYCYHLKQTS